MYTGKSEGQPQNLTDQTQEGIEPFQPVKKADRRSEGILHSVVQARVSNANVMNETEETVSPVST
jgi:fructose-1,6-bisphosphatase/inositol monophosphatase family enzyme